MLRWLARAALSLAGSRSVLRLVRRGSPDVVVSTWPPATLILGSLRLRGKVLVPACATITDFAGLELWADKGVDLHLVMHEGLVPGVERIAGPGSARPVSPMVAPEFQAPRASVEARCALGLPSEGRSSSSPVAAGAWATSREPWQRARARRDGGLPRRTGSGDSRASRDPVRREPRVQVLGFTDSMNDLLAAADVLVHSTGGVTCLEASPATAPWSPTARLRSRTAARAGDGLARARRARALCDRAESRVLGAGDRSKVTLSRGVDAASLVLAAIPRVAVRPRARFARTMASTAAATALLFALLASDATYPVVAEALALPESTTIVPANDSVALVVEGKRRELMALGAVARKNHLHASVAASEPLSGQDVTALRTDGLDPLPELSSRGVRSWFHAHGQLESQRARYRLNGSFPYLAPREGFTIADYLLARHLGGVPIQAGYSLTPHDFAPAAVHSGEVILARLDNEPGDDTGHLLAAVRLIERSGLGVSSVQRLLGRGRSA